MCIVSAVQRIKPKLYNPLRHMRKVKNLTAKEEKKLKIKELKELIPEISEVAIGVLNRDCYFQKNKNIINQVKAFSIYSKPPL